MFWSRALHQPQELVFELDPRGCCIEKEVLKEPIVVVGSRMVRICVLPEIYGESVCLKGLNLIGSDRIRR